MRSGAATSRARIAKILPRMRNSRWSPHWRPSVVSGNERQYSRIASMFMSPEDCSWSASYPRQGRNACGNHGGRVKILADFEEESTMKLRFLIVTLSILVCSCTVWSDEHHEHFNANEKLGTVSF